MTLAVCLAVYGVLVCLAAPRLLLGHAAGHAPRLGVACWLFAVVSVLGAWTGAITLLVIEVAGFGAVALVLVVWHVGRVAGSAHRAGRRHSQAVRLAGRSFPRLGRDTVVVDVPERAAYCVAGGRGTVVVTTGTLAALSGTELGAVLAHERAHLAGRHHLIMTALSALRRTLRVVPLFAHAEREVGRLLEMSADDAAAGRCGRGALLAALLAMTGVRAPQGALGAAAVGVIARARRLAQPATPGERAAARRALAGALAALSVGPALTFAVMALTVCPMMLG